MPDFYRSGLMPLAHQYYEVIGELIDNDFNVVFPEWGRRSFGVATHIRGYENFLSDMISNPKFAHRILRLITDTRKEWITERAKFLGKCKGKGNIYNDEVNCPSLSPELYEEFALPYELELSDFHGGILYFHSCGDTTKLLPLIAKINTIEMFHVGPWIGGCSYMKAFFRILFPAALPGIVSTAILAFMFSWNELLFVLTIAGGRIVTLPVFMGHTTTGI